MPYYLTDTVDVDHGGRVSSKPVGWDLSDEWAILRLDGFKAVMWSRDPIVSAGIEHIGDDKEETMAVATRRGLDNVRRDAKDLPVRLGSALGDLLMNPAGNRWKPLRSMTDGMFRVKLGRETLWEVPDPRGPRHSSKLAADNFDRADGNLDGSTSSDGQFQWVETQGTALTVVGNKVRATGVTGGTACQANFTLDTDDHDVSLEVLAMTLVSDRIVCNAVSRGTGVDFAGGGYSGSFANTGGALTGEIWNLAVGALTNVGIAGVTGLLRFTTNGSALEMFRNGVSISSTTDTAIVDVFKGGNRCYMGGNSGNLIDWRGFIIKDFGFTGRSGSTGMFDNDMRARSWW